MPITLNSLPVHESTMVKMVNEGDTVFRKQYGGQWWTLEPGVPKMVPFYAMCMWVGHPNAQNVSGGKDSEQHRTLEIRRLSTYYGTQGDPWYAEDDHGQQRLTSTGGEKDSEGEKVKGRSYHNGIHPNIPKLAVYSLEDDSRIITVLDDPEGVAEQSQGTTLSTQRDMEATIKRLSDTQAELLELLRDQNPAMAERLAATHGGGPGFPTEPTQIILPDAEGAESLGAEEFVTPDDVSGNPTSSLDSIPVQDVPATVDIPPSQRPRTNQGARAQAAAQRGDS